MTGLFKNVLYTVTAPISLKASESASVDIACLELHGISALVYNPKENEKGMLYDAFT